MSTILALRRNIGVPLKKYAKNINHVHSQLTTQMALPVSDLEKL